MQQSEKQRGASTLTDRGGGYPPAFNHEIGVADEINPHQPVVLVADDEGAIRSIVRFTLQEAGYFVLTAADGEQALDLSRGFHGTIHVLVTDMVMPKLDGMALRKCIVRERPNIKVLLMSGSAGQPFEGVAFLPKPFNPVQLEQRVQQLLD